MDLLEKVKNWLLEATKLLGLSVTVSILVSVLCATYAPICDSGLTNIEPVIATLGSEGLDVIIALIIILGVWKSRS